MRAHRAQPPWSSHALTGAVATIFLSACGEPPPPPPVAETAAVLVAPTALELRAGQTVQLTAQANDEANQAIGGAELEFVADTPAIADVTHQGLVTATGPVGIATIRVLAGRAEAKVPVVVRAGEPQSLAAVPPASPSATMPDAGAPAKGAAPGRSFAVRALDAFGNPVAEVAVSFRVVAGDGAAADATVATDADGVARTTWIPADAPGEHVLEASAQGVPPVFDRGVSVEPGLASAEATEAATAAASSPASGRAEPERRSAVDSARQ